MFDLSFENPLLHLLSLAKNAGADFAEFFLENRSYLSCVVENEKVTSTNPSLNLGAGVRLFKDKKDCYVSTNDISFFGLEKALKKALDILNLSLSLNEKKKEVFFRPFHDYGLTKNKNNWQEKCSSTKEICDVLLQCNKLQRKISHNMSATTNAFCDLQEVLIAATDGTFVRDIRLNQSLSAQVMCVDKEHRTAVHKRIGGTSDTEFFRKLSLDYFVHELSKSAGHMLHADYVQAGTYPVVLSNQFGGVLFHEACGHLLETTAVQSKSTPFLHKMGEKIAHENVTAWDEGIWDQGFGSLDVDDEGMPAQRTCLIEKGILKNFLCDRAGHLLTNYPRTASGRRQNHTFAPASRMRNTYIDSGKWTREELLSSMDKGLYCKSLGGGSVSGTGDFNFAVEEGWLVENGKITKPVKGATLIGYAPDVMQMISMCGNDLDVAAGFCGSVSGSIYVTVGQPHVKVDSMTVGGR